MIVTDSNGRDLRTNLIKPEAHVTKETRYTIDEATKSIPKARSNSSVSDIVFMVGLNDCVPNNCAPSDDAKDIQEKYFEMQMKYAQHFPNARQHVTALPPMNEFCVEVNEKLQKLSKYTGSNYISTKAFLDRATGKLRANVMVGKHYNEWGIRMLAKELKKSLYSTANIGNKALSQLIDNSWIVACPATADHDLNAIHGA